MKAITTVYLAPSANRGPRMKATDSDGNSATIDYPMDLQLPEVHEAACQQLCARMGWKGTLIGGHMAKGMVWVWIDDHSPRVSAT